MLDQECVTCHAMPDNECVYMHTRKRMGREHDSRRIMEYGVWCAKYDKLYRDKDLNFRVTRSTMEPKHNPMRSRHVQGYFRSSRMGEAA